MKYLPILIVSLALLVSSPAYSAEREYYYLNGQVNVINEYTPAKQVVSILLKDPRTQSSLVLFQFDPPKKLIELINSGLVQNTVYKIDYRTLKNSKKDLRHHKVISISSFDNQKLYRDH